MSAWTFLDMDPGVDDAVALAAAVSRLHIAGVTTVAGNVEAEKTFANAGRLLNLMGRPDIPLVPGSTAPLFYPLVTARRVHGESGLDGFPFEGDVPARVPSSSLPAWAWMADRVASFTVPVQWVATGPLTNVAKFIWGYGHLRPRFTTLTVMGGSLAGGNITPHAEFNFYVDPDAAEAVLASGWEIRVVGLDVTHKATLNDGEVAQFARFGRVGAALGAMVAAYSRRTENGGEGTVSLHDAVAVFAAERPDLLEWETLPLEVVRMGPERGALKRSRDPARQPVSAAVNIDRTAFLHWLWQSLKAYAPDPTASI